MEDTHTIYDLTKMTSTQLRDNFLTDLDPDKEKTLNLILSTFVLMNQGRIEKEDLRSCRELFGKNPIKNAERFFYDGIITKLSSLVEAERKITDLEYLLKNCLDLSLNPEDFSKEIESKQKFYEYFCLPEDYSPNYERDGQLIKYIITNNNIAQVVVIKLLNLFKEKGADLSYRMHLSEDNYFDLCYLIYPKDKKTRVFKWFLENELFGYCTDTVNYNLFYNIMQRRDAYTKNKLIDIILENFNQTLFNQLFKKYTFQTRKSTVLKLMSTMKENEDIFNKIKTKLSEAGYSEEIKNALK
jgi:hypothetical protein